MSDPFETPCPIARQAALCPWDFPGKNTGVGCHFLLQEIFLTQESDLLLVHCRQTLYLWNSLCWATVGWCSFQIRAAARRGHEMQPEPADTTTTLRDCLFSGEGCAYKLGQHPHSRSRFSEHVCLSICICGTLLLCQKSILVKNQ